MRNKEKLILFLFVSFFSFGENKKEEASKVSGESVSQLVKTEENPKEEKKSLTKPPKKNQAPLKALKTDENKGHKKIKNSVKTSKTKSSQPIEIKKSPKEKKTSKTGIKKKQIHTSEISKTEVQNENMNKSDKKTKKEKKQLKKISSKAETQKKSSFPSKKKKGVRVLKIKKGSIFEDLGFKENDIISKINGIFIKNVKHFIKQLKKIKNNSSFTFTLIRNNKTLLLNYIVEKDPDSSKYKYSLVKTSPQKEKPDPEDILKKYSHLFQKAYVQQPGGSLVYEKASFDSKQIYMIPFGEQIVISKKVLKPKKEIGTFYKIFIKKPQKIAGYISQVEVLPQTIKKGNKYVSNPEYALWKKKVKKNPLDDQGIFASSFSESVKEEKEIEEIDRKTKSGRFIGVTLGTSFESKEKFTDKLRFGLKLSGYNLLVSYINMDINFLFDSHWNNMSIDIMGGYIFLKAGSFKAGPALGLNTNLQFKNQEIRLDMIVALSGLLPLTQNLIWRNDIRFTGFFNKPVNPYFLTALQWGF